MQVTRAREFSVYLQDRPGELAGVLEAHAADGATLIGVTVSEINGRGLVRLIGAPEEALRKACEQLCDAGAGPVAESDVLIAHLDGQLDGFREIAIHLAADGINVRYAYYTGHSNGTPMACVIRVDDLEAAERAIQALP